MSASAQHRYNLYNHLKPVATRAKLEAVQMNEYRRGGKIIEVLRTNFVRNQYGYSWSGRPREAQDQFLSDHFMHMKLKDI